MNTAALSRNPSRPAAVRNPVAGFVNLISRYFRMRAKIGKDRRTLQAVPTGLLADMGLERMDIRTSTGDHSVWIRPRR